jgi:hypothetical protein
MMQKYRNIILLAVLAIVLTGTLALPLRHKINMKMKYMADRGMNLLNDRKNSCDNCASLFDDRVAVHEHAYQTEGIPPQAKDAGLEELLANKTLIEISSNQYYTVRDLSFSMPYLLPKAQEFVDTLALSYQIKCQESNLTYYPFTISSGTRSVASVQKLMEQNRNSIRNSGHLRGKTFDVSFSAFGDNQE